MVRRALLVLAAWLPLALVTYAPVSAWAAPRRSPADGAISAAVADALAHDPAVPHGVRFEVMEGTVLLRGNVPHLPARHRAEQLVGSVDGVRIVVNQLEVQPLHPFSDRTVATSIVRALLLDHATAALNIDVAVHQGVATLYGTVSAYGEAALVLHIASRTVGVTGIKDNIAVHYGAERPPEEVQAAIEGRLRWDRRIAADDIRVLVSPDRAVRLVGTVASLAEKRRAWHNAWVDGVATLDARQLEVRPRTSPARAPKASVKPSSDEAIARAVRTAMRYHPRAGSDVMTVKVSKGVVSLHGEVDTWSASRAALQVAKSTVAVRKVRNFTQVRPSASDAKVRARILSAFALNALTDGHDIGVQVDNQFVRVTGTVNAHYESIEAERVATHIRGVRSVQNDLAVGHEHAKTSPSASESRPGMTEETDDFFNYNRQRTQWGTQRALWRWANPL